MSSWSECLSVVKAKERVQSSLPSFMKIVLSSFCVHICVCGSGFKVAEDHSEKLLVASQRAACIICTKLHTASMHSSHA